MFFPGGHWVASNVLMCLLGGHLWQIRVLNLGLVKNWGLWGQLPTTLIELVSFVPFVAIDQGSVHPRIHLGWRAASCVWRLSAPATCFCVPGAWGLSVAFKELVSYFTLVAMESVGSPLEPPPPGQPGIKESFQFPGIKEN